MNYIEEINEFYNRIEMMSLSKSAISLWHALMHMNNKAKWSDTFTVPLKILEGKTGVKSKELYKARSELTEAGMIQWSERSGKRCALYKLISFKDRKTVAEKIPGDDTPAGGQTLKDPKNPDGQIGLFDQGNGRQNGDVIGEVVGDIVGDVVGDNSGSILGSINKQEEIKQNNSEPKGSLSSADDMPCRNSIDVCRIYNTICKRLPRANSLTDSRRQSINQRLKEHGPQKVRQMLRLAAESDFLAGYNHNSWMANIDWLFRAANFIKVLDGCYDNRPDMQDNKPSSYYIKPSPFEVLKDCFKTITGDDPGDC